MTVEATLKSTPVSNDEQHPHTVGHPLHATKTYMDVKSNVITNLSSMHQAIVKVNSFLSNKTIMLLNTRVKVVNIK